MQQLKLAEGAVQLLLELFVLFLEADGLEVL